MTAPDQPLSPSLRWPVKRWYEFAEMKIRERNFVWGSRTYIMGIINVTPDSFSGDGIGDSVDAALELAKNFEADGVDIIDIGAESTRPDAEPLAPGEELERLLPVLRAVRAATELPISVDTYRAGVAERAVVTGADMINDVRGLQADPEMAAVAELYQVPIVAMHNQRGREFHDVAEDIAAGFETMLEIAQRARLPRSKIILDPGFGFGWEAHQNFEMIRRLPELFRFEVPLLIGTSRKSSIGYLLDEPAEGRGYGTASSVALAIAAGADIVRVHDVAEMRQVALVADAITRDNWRHDA